MVELIICPFCNHKSVYYRESFKSYRCNKCFKEFIYNNSKPILMGLNELLDEYGNKYTLDIRKLKEKIILIKTYFLPKGKQTLKGKYPKIIKDCLEVSRDSCNNGYGFHRCMFMKYTNNEWICERWNKQTET